MQKRFAAIWFRHLIADWIVRCKPALKDIPFVVARPEHGRMVVTAVNPAAEINGIQTGMVVADCRAILPSLQVFDEKPEQTNRLLKALGEWCIRYTPIVAIDLPDGLLLDISGCAHLWGNEQAYLHNVFTRLNNYGYDIRIAIADTIGTAWALSRFGQTETIIKSGCQIEALLPLPPSALRVETNIIERLNKLGLYTIRSFMNMPRPALRRRFGQSLLMRLDQAIGQEIEVITPIVSIEPYQERLPSLEPIQTATGIEIALEKLVEELCKRLAKEEKGLRRCIFKCYRIDGNVQQIEIGTNRPTRNTEHLFKLFEIKISRIEPALGIELFVLDAPVVEELSAQQDTMWDITNYQTENQTAELLDRISGRVGAAAIHRYLPDEHYWPERSIKLTASLQEKPITDWRSDLPRPIHLLQQPEPIEVTVPIPDYPPMLFHYKGKLYTIKKADGPERIEQEWWLQKGVYRDYYCLEDEDGGRFWVFRSGNYLESNPKWYIHGFFA